MQMYQEHHGAVNDVAWHHQGVTFAAVNDDGRLVLWDTRQSNKQQVSACKAHDGQTLTVDFDPRDSQRLATGGSDGVVAVWDMRQLSRARHELRQHADDVIRVSWNEHVPGVLATCSMDRYVLVWDANLLEGRPVQHNDIANNAEAGQMRCARKGQTLTQLSNMRQHAAKSHSKQAGDLAPAGLLFVHGGHMSGVNDIAWNPDRPWMLASTSGPAVGQHDPDVIVQPNIMQVWEIMSEARTAWAG